MFEKIKRNWEKASLKRKIKTYEILLENQKKKGLGEFSPQRLAVEQNLKDCKNALQKI
jgi:hypothetical protein